MAGISPRARVAAWVAAGVLGGGLVAGAVVTQLGVATAASPTPRPGSQQPRGHEGFGPMGPGPLERLGGRVLHGQATIRTPSGADQVVEFQSGSITAVGGSTVTVRSSDGFTETYTVDKTTRISLNGADGALSTLKKGDDVRVFGMSSAGKVVAKAVMDGQPDGPFGRMWRHGPGPRWQMPPMPAPGASASTSGSSSNT